MTIAEMQYVLLSHGVKCQYKSYANALVCKFGYNQAIFRGTKKETLRQALLELAGVEA